MHSSTTIADRGRSGQGARQRIGRRGHSVLDVDALENGRCRLRSPTVTRHPGPGAGLARCAEGHGSPVDSPADAPTLAGLLAVVDGVAEIPELYASAPPSRERPDARLAREAVRDPGLSVGDQQHLAPALLRIV